MKHWRVMVDVHYKRVIWVDAENQLDAREKARDIAYNEAYGDADICVNEAEEEV